MGQAGKVVKTCHIKRVLFGNYVKVNWRFQKGFARCNPTLGCSEDILSAAIP
jgi:hypothetical protein